MSTHKHIDQICCVAIVLTLLLTVVFINGESLGIQAASKAKGYETRLFDTSTVHTIDIVMDDWEGFLETCTSEEYALCSVVIDQEAYKNVAIRAKGNTSLTQVASYGNNRYSFKIEFDHYDSTKRYYGLDKLSLNNIIQDNTYLKDYLTYQMMGYFGVDAPLCSYVYITVNGEEWGLYLAVEGVEEAFLERNYGSDYGALYKPDSQSMGGGRGNGGNFDIGDWQQESSSGENTTAAQQPGSRMSDADFTLERLQTMLNALDDTALQQAAQALGYTDSAEMLSALDSAASMEAFLNGKDLSSLLPLLGGRSGMAMPDTGSTNTQGGMRLPGGNMENEGGGMGGAMGSSDVSLIYSDDEYSSYQNIFNNAKTDITDADKDRLIASLRQLNECENLEEVVDIDEVIRYFVVHNFVCNFDSYTGSMIHNYYLYEENGQLSMIPWDYNLAFGGFQGAQDATALVNYPIDTPVSGGTVDSRPMLAWIFSSEEYTALYHQYFSTFISDYFNIGYCTGMIERTQELISPYVEKDPTKFCTYEEFEAGIETLKAFCLLRAESISGQLEGTIASTSDGQLQSSDTLIDASGINISDMGSMNNSMGGGMNMQNRMGGFDPANESQTTGQTQESNAQSQTENPPSTSANETQNDTGARQNSNASDPPQNGAASDTQPPEMPDNAWQQGNRMQNGNAAGSSFENLPGGDRAEDTAATDQSASAWLLLGASALILIAGILIAAFYKKRS